MQRIRMVVPCLMVAFAITGLASTTASGATEIGRCEKQVGGKYKDTECTKLAVPAGNWEWTPGAVKNKFTATAKTNVLESLPAKAKITCKTAEATGEYTTPTTEDVDTVEFTGCEDKAAKVVCESSKAAGNNVPGTILGFPLVGEFGLIKKPNHAGVDLEGTVAAGPPFATDLLANFECGAKAQGNGTGAQLFVEGDVIGEIAPTDKMLLVTKLKFVKTAAGAQNPENFEGGPNTHLITWLFNGAGALVENANEVSTFTTTNEEALELRA